MRETRLTIMSTASWAIGRGVLFGGNEGEGRGEADNMM